MILETAIPKASRVSAVIEAVRRIPIPALGSNPSGSNWPQLTPLDSRSCSHDRTAIQAEPDGYQVALIPFRAAADGAVLNTPFSGHVCQILLLPLIWEDLVSQNFRQSIEIPVAENEHLVQFGEVRINFRTHEAFRSNHPVSLTAMEFKTLKFFISNPYRVLSRDELLNEVWGYDNYPCTRTVDNRILKLRQRLEKDATNPVHFRTVHGVGYRFTP